MAHSDLPKNVRQLIVRHIDSVQQVEILALLRSAPDRDWSVAEISRSLHIAPAASQTWLDAFAAARLVRRTDAGYRHGNHAAAADQLVDWYSRRRSAVVESIYSKPSTAIQSFSDAFRLRRDD